MARLLFKHLQKQRQLHRLYVRQMASSPIKVQVKQGIVVGQQRLLPNGNAYNSFQGIPYAVPPLGELRFKSPVQLSQFESAELDCTEERSVSHQRDPITQQVLGSENCLFLNVYAPQKQQYATPALPVMVWIHGGGFWFGNGNSEYYNPLSFLEDDVVVVTLNYRLGALGFLCLPEEGIWGNAGLKDQRLALQWVRENIAQFNGNPENVTIFGESAGAASVHLHAYAAHANTLFHKAIMQSGTANMEWVFQADPAYKTRRLAQLLGCKSQNTRDILAFLQSEQATPIGILANTIPVLTPDERRRGLPLTFKPVIEDVNSTDSFINEPILKLLQQPNKLKIPIIMGYNSAEGLAMTVNVARRITLYEEDLVRLVPRNIPYPPEHPIMQQLAERMRDFYLAGGQLNAESLNQLTEMLSDYHFTVDMQQAAEWHVRLQKQSPLYFYRFDYVGKRNIYKKIFQLEKLHGACHGDELFYQFQMREQQPSELDDAEDALLTKRINRLWTHFARYGEPIPQTEAQASPVLDFNWLPVRCPSSVHAPFMLDYLAIDKQCEMRVNPEKERIQFWREIYSKFKPIDYSRLSAKL